MEQISSICGLLCALCLVIAPIAFVVWIVMLIAKSKRKKKAKRVFFGALAGIVLFTAIGVATDPSTRCEHNWEAIGQNEPTCTESGAVIEHCPLCDTERDGEEIPPMGHTWVEARNEPTCTESGTMTASCAFCGTERGVEEIPPMGHTWVETRKEATCTEQGEIIKECSACGSKTSEMIVAQHNYVETIVSEPKCASEGAAQFVCSHCGDKQDKSIPATGHSLSTATCTEPKTCSVCGVSEGEPLGHTTDCGLCARCQEAVKKLSPVTFVGMRWTKDYVGGIEWTFRIRNNSDKEIKYITFQWSCYNAVGDPIYDEIDGKNYVRIRFTGPLAPGETTDLKRNTSLFYNHSYATMKWNEITVEYMDGTKESITEYHYGYYEQ